MDGLEIVSYKRERGRMTNYTRVGNIDIVTASRIAAGGSTQCSASAFREPARQWQRK